jgi:mRNA interferase RelE/StbE
VNYSIIILRRAQSELASLPKESYEKVKAAISALSDNARPHGCKKLIGREGWRIRVGKYHMIYNIDNKAQTIAVLHVGHRSNIYR